MGFVKKIPSLIEAYKSKIGRSKRYQCIQRIERAWNNDIYKQPFNSVKLVKHKEDKNRKYIISWLIDKLNDILLVF